jgi:hypothetical protein
LQLESKQGGEATGLSGSTVASKSKSIANKVKQNKTNKNKLTK